MMQDTEAMLAQMFCRSDATAQQMIAGAKNSVDDRMATAMDPIDLFIEAIKMGEVPVAVQIELKVVEVGALLSVALSHSGTFTRVPERTFYSEGMELLLRRLAQITPSMHGYTIDDWLEAAIYGSAPGERPRRLSVYGASRALRAVMVNHEVPSSSFV